MQNKVTQTKEEIWHCLLVIFQSTLTSTLVLTHVDDTTRNHKLSGTGNKLERVLALIHSLFNCLKRSETHTLRGKCKQMK